MFVTLILHLVSDDDIIAMKQTMHRARTIHVLPKNISEIITSTETRKSTIMVYREADFLLRNDASTTMTIFSCQTKSPALMYVNAAENTYKDRTFKYCPKYLSVYH